MKVLIVDDEIEICKRLESELKKEGCKVEYTTSAVGVVEKIYSAKSEGKPYELLFLDLRMPKVDGLEILKEIREAGLDLDVIIITAYGDEDKAIEAIHLGAVDYLRKPISLEELRNAVFRVRTKRASEEDKALKHRILVVDDEKDLCERIKQKLDKEGYDVAVAYDGVEGLEYFESNYVDVVIADIRMPRMNGLEMLEKCREINPDFASIIITGFGDHEKAIASLRLGVFNYLRKPISFKELVPSVSKGIEVIGLRRGLSARRRELEIETALKTQYAEKLEHEKRFTENIVATVPDSLLVLNPDLRIKSANRSFYETFQTEPEKMIGTRITDILGDKDGKLGTELTRLFGTDDMLEHFELHYKSEKLGDRIFNIKARGIIFAEEEEEEEELVLLEDITERKRAEEALRESEEKYRSLVESTEDSIYLVDRNFRYLFMNEKRLSRFGLPREKVIGRTYGEFHSEEEAKEFAGKVKAVFETAESLSYEYRSERDGRYFLRTLSPVREPDGRIVTMTVVSKDINDRKQAEEALRRAHNELEIRVQERTADLAKVNEALGAEITERKRAEEELKEYQEKLEQMVEDRTRELKETQKELVNKAMEAGRAQFSAMVLHNIGNAITPMKVHMEEMKADELEKITHYFEKCYLDLKEHAGNLQHYVNNDPRGKEVFSYMGKLVDSLKDREKQKKAEVEKIDSAVSYISEILSLQHAYTAREQETKERTDLNSLIEDATRMQAGTLEKRGISVREALDHNIPKLLTDKNRLMQVMVNLIKNSYEAIDELKDGSKEKVISIKSFAEDGDVGFEITDSGIGIEPENMESIFEFGKSRKGSPGVGLYYCKMFVEANKGRLHISSAGRGKGATVSVSFPATEWIADHKGLGNGRKQTNISC